MRKSARPRMCNECGAVLSRTSPAAAELCPNCGKPNVLKANYWCPHCGRAMYVRRPKTATLLCFNCREAVLAAGGKQPKRTPKAKQKA